MCSEESGVALPTGTRTLGASWLCAVCGDLGKPGALSTQTWGVFLQSLGTHTSIHNIEIQRRADRVQGCDAAVRSGNQTPKQRTSVSKASEGNETPVNR